MDSFASCFKMDAPVYREASWAFVALCRSNSTARSTALLTVLEGVPNPRTRT